MNEGIASEIIKVTPREGVYYDNTLGFQPETIDGSYYYMDGDFDGKMETILVADVEGNIIAVGFDYDYNSYFVPHKRDLVHIHVRESQFSEDEGYFNSSINYWTVMTRTMIISLLKRHSRTACLTYGKFNSLGVRVYY